MIKILKSFFYSKENFQPIYFWATIFLCLISIGIVMRYLDLNKISDTLIIGLCGFIVAIIGFYNYFKEDKK